MRNFKKSIAGAGFLAGILLALYFITPWLDVAFPAVQAESLPQWIWFHIWTILLGVFFASGHIRTWWENQGRFRVNYVYLAFTVILALSYLPLPGWPFDFLRTLKQNDVVLIVFWYSALHIVYKDKKSYDYLEFSRL